MTNTDVIKLKPCPCCDNAEPCELVAPCGYCVECTECGVRTDYHDTRKEAQNRWNRRASVTEQAELVVQGVEAEGWTLADRDAADIAAQKHRPGEDNENQMKRLMFIDGYLCAAATFRAVSAHPSPALPAAMTEEPQKHKYRCTPKNGGTPFEIDRAPDSWELRECDIEAICPAPSQAAAMPPAAQSGETFEKWAEERGLNTLSEPGKFAYEVWQAALASSPSAAPALPVDKQEPHPCERQCQQAKMTGDPQDACGSDCSMLSFAEHAAQQEGKQKAYGVEPMEVNADKGHPIPHDAAMSILKQGLKRVRDAHVSAPPAPPSGSELPPLEPSELLDLAWWHGAQACNRHDYEKEPKRLHARTAEVLREMHRHMLAARSMPADHVADAGKMVSAAPALPVDKQEPMRAYVEDFAKRHGWNSADGEGAFEFIQRASYRTGWEDGRREASNGPHRDDPAPTSGSELPQMPEPFGYLCDWGRSYDIDRQRFYYAEPGSASEDDWNESPKVYKNLPLYTEDQVRALLAGSSHAKAEDAELREIIDAAHWSIAFLYQHSEIGKAELLRKATQRLENMK